MKALKCDICGGYFDGLTCLNDVEETTSPNKLSIYYRTDNGHVQDWCLLDICPECYMAIKKTMDDRIKRRIEECSD